MRVLAIDTSSPVSAIAVVDGERVLAHDDAHSEQRHAEVLLPRIGAALAQSGLTLRDIQLLAVGIGPGSFTGLRVGLATAKGLAIATRLSLCGVSSLRVLARAIAGRREVALCVLDAGKGEVLAAAYRGAAGDLVEVWPPLRGEPAEIGRELRRRELDASRALACGSGARRHSEAIASGLGAALALAEPACDAPNGVQVAREGAERFGREGPSDLGALEPLYLRGSDAKLPDEPLAL
jgi:tRNA threonylcarbamoyladenosine biosynthesis protein TsaB